MFLLQRADKGVRADLLIRDVKLVDTAGICRGDLYIRDGLIHSIGVCLAVNGVPVLEGNGRTLLPAFVDMHAHFRDPGYPEKEDIGSGSAAAVKGGYTAVSLMANTDPVCDRPEVAAYMYAKAKGEGLIEVFPVGAITRGLEGDELSDMEGLAPLVWAFSDDGNGVQRPEVMLRACRQAAAVNRPLFTHCEYRGIEDCGIAEELMVNRDLYLSRRGDCALHIAHVSTPGSVELIKAAKQEGVRVTCEVTPHHLCLDRRHDYIVNPPLVDPQIQERLTAALAAGLIDVVATDHAPHTYTDKKAGAPGISGIETAFSLLYSRLVRPGRLGLTALVRAMAMRPARLLGVNKGVLDIGYDGDVVLIEEDEEFTVTEEWLLSRGKNTPILGASLHGRVWATVHRGEVVYIDDKVCGRDFDDYRSVV